ncbi:MAG: copper transporter [Bacillota bacterium]
MFDLRHFVVALAAVFLSLGLGLFIGANLPPEEGLAARQEALISKLEAEFATLRAENRYLNTRLTTLQELDEANRALEEALAALLLEGQLGGLRVVVVQTSQDAPAASAVRTLELAGADVAWLRPPFASPPAGDLLARAVLARSPELAGLELVSGGLDHPVDAVVVAGGASRQGRLYTADVELPLITTLVDAGLSVVGVQQYDAWQSSLPAFRERQLATVSHVDRLPGQLALVYLLCSPNHHGAFGLGAFETIWPELSFLRVTP